MKFLRGDRCNATLRGGRSILLSYWGKDQFILPKAALAVNATEEKSIKVYIFIHSAIAKLAVSLYNNYL
jgi:hypothetical protein